MIVYVMDYYTIKEVGESNYANDKAHPGRQDNKSPRSKKIYGCMNGRIRGIRRRADRNSHHRRRGYIRDLQAHDLLTGTEVLCGLSSSFSSEACNYRSSNSIAKMILLPL